VDAELRDLALPEREVVAAFESHPHLGAVARLVGLRARRAHGGTLARVQAAVLDAGEIDDARHLATERIELLHEVPLRDTADRRIARHLRDHLERAGQHEHARAHPRRGECGLAPGVARTDDDHVVAVGVLVRHFSPRAPICTREPRHVPH
jgi:hypothetical protein